MEKSPLERVRRPGKVPPMLKRLASPLLDPIGERLLTPPICGMWGVHLHGDRTVKRLALTFDDGPAAGSTEQVLDVLGEYSVPGTFFFLGDNTLLNPRIVERTAAEGHVVGNHSMHHSRIDGISLADCNHFLESERVLHDVLGYAPRLYRSPWGWSSPWEVRRLRRHGLEPIGWDVYTLDWQRPAPCGKGIARKAIHEAQPGSIFLFHDGFPAAVSHCMPETVRALRIVIPRMVELGYTFVTVSDLLGLSPRKEAA